MNLQMDNFEKHELIERYLANEMPEEQRRAFEEQLSANKELFDEISINRELSTLLNNERLNRFLDAVHETDKKWQFSAKEKKSKTINMYARIILSVAASLIIIIFTWQYFSVAGDDPSEGRLYAAYFEPYQMLLSQRSEADTTGHAVLINMAVMDYANGNYSSAAGAFQQLWDKEQKNISYKFYHAISLMGSDNAQEAIAILEELLEMGDHLFTEQSRWYLALARLSAGDKEKASLILQTIQPGEFHYNESRELLSELD